MTKREKYLERIHLLRTLVNYGPLHASDLADRANSECDHDVFDDLPEISRRGIGQKLQAMEDEGLVAGSFLGVGLPKLWEIVEGGRKAVAIFESEDGDNWRIGPDPDPSDYLLIERVLYGLWAPQDRAPQSPAEILRDGESVLSINDVERARRALDRLRGTR